MNNVKIKNTNENISTIASNAKFKIIINKTQKIVMNNKK
jgi:hypothetical protein